MKAIAALDEDEHEDAEIHELSPAVDGEETDEDSDRCEVEHEEHPNHFGSALLHTECELVNSH